MKKIFALLFLISSNVYSFNDMGNYCQGDSPNAMGSIACNILPEGLLSKLSNNQTPVYYKTLEEIVLIKQVLKEEHLICYETSKYEYERPLGYDGDIIKKFIVDNRENKKIDSSLKAIIEALKNAYPCKNRHAAH